MSDGSYDYGHVLHQGRLGVEKTVRLNLIGAANPKADVTLLSRMQGRKKGYRGSEQHDTRIHADDMSQA